MPTVCRLLVQGALQCGLDRCDAVDGDDCDDDSDGLDAGFHVMMSDQVNNPRVPPARSYRPPPPDIDSFLRSNLSVFLTGSFD